jgi:hypothetical protein
VRYCSGSSRSGTPFNHLALSGFAAVVVLIFSKTLLDPIGMVDGDEPIDVPLLLKQRLQNQEDTLERLVRIDEYAGQAGDDMVEVNISPSVIASVQRSREIFSFPAVRTVLAFTAAGRSRSQTGDAHVRPT